MFIVSLLSFVSVTGYRSVDSLDVLCSWLLVLWAERLVSNSSCAWALGLSGQVSDGSRRLRSCFHDRKVRQCLHLSLSLGLGARNSHRLVFGVLCWVLCCSYDIFHHARPILIPGKGRLPMSVNAPWAVSTNCLEGWVLFHYCTIWTGARWCGHTSLTCPITLLVVGKDYAHAHMAQVRDPHSTTTNRVKTHRPDETT